MTEYTEFTAQHSSVATYERWSLAQGLSPRTIQSRIETIKLLATWSNADPVWLSPDEIMRWMAAQRHWQPSTRATYHASLRAWYGWLVKQGHRADNPTDRTGRPKRPSGVPRPVEQDELARLLATPMRRKTWAMIHFAGLAGLRVHEIAKIRGQDYHSGVLTVCGKGGKVVRLPLHPELVKIAERMPRRGYWFPSTKYADRPMLARSVSSTIGKVMERADVPHSAHHLRHWFGTNLVDIGVDLRTTQELLRHSSLATTQIYTRVTNRKLGESVARLAFRPTAAA